MVDIKSKISGKKSKWSSIKESLPVMDSMQPGKLLVKEEPKPLTKEEQKVSGYKNLIKGLLNEGVGT